MSLIDQATKFENEYISAVEAFNPENDGTEITQKIFTLKEKIFYIAVLGADQPHAEKLVELKDRISVKHNEFVAAQEDNVVSSAYLALTNPFDRNLESSTVKRVNALAEAALVFLNYSQSNDAAQRCSWIKERIEAINANFFRDEIKRLQLTSDAFYQRITALQDCKAERNSETLLNLKELVSAIVNARKELENLKKLGIKSDELDLLTGKFNRALFSANEKIMVAGTVRIAGFKNLLDYSSTNKNYFENQGMGPDEVINMLKEAIDSNQRILEKEWNIHLFTSQEEYQHCVNTFNNSKKGVQKLIVEYEQAVAMCDIKAKKTNPVDEMKYRVNIPSVDIIQSDGKRHVYSPFYYKKDQRVYDIPPLKEFLSTFDLNKVNNLVFIEVVPKESIVVLIRVDIKKDILRAMLAFGIFLCRGTNDGGREVGVEQEKSIKFVYITSQAHQAIAASLLDEKRKPFQLLDNMIKREHSPNLDYSNMRLSFVESNQEEKK